MKDRRGGAGFPFSIGCMSLSAVAVADPLDKKAPVPAPARQHADNPSSSTTTTATAQDRVSREEGTGGEEKAKEGIVAAGVHRLLKGIKTFFAAYEGEEEDDEEREIVIGYPTDVQHVGHIGWDGSNKVGGMGVGVGVGMVGAFSLPASLSSASSRSRDRHGPRRRNHHLHQLIPNSPLCHASCSTSSSSNRCYLGKKKETSEWRIC